MLFRSYYQYVEKLTISGWGWGAVLAWVNLRQGWVKRPGSDAHEGAEGGGDAGRGRGKGGQVVAPREEKQLGQRGDESEGGAHLLRAAKWVPRAVNEKGRDAEPGEVRGPRLAGAARRVQRVGEKEEAGGRAGIFHHQHAGLTPSVGMAAEEEAAGGDGAEGGGGGQETGAVPRGVPGGGRAMGACLAEGQIAAQDSEALLRESPRHRGEERRPAIGPGAMGEHEPVGSGGGMEKPAHARSGKFDGFGHPLRLHTPRRACTMGTSGRGAAWLARLLGVQEVPGSNPGGPTKQPRLSPSIAAFPPSRAFGIRVDRAKNVKEIGQLGRSVNKFRGRSFA